MPMMLSEIFRGIEGWLEARMRRGFEPGSDRDQRSFTVKAVPTVTRRILNRAKEWSKKSSNCQNVGGEPCGL